MKKSNVTADIDIPENIDFSAGVRGKYAVNFPKGSRLVLLDSDVAEVFPTQESANEALRGLAAIVKKARSSKSRSKSKSATDHK